MGFGILRIAPSLLCEMACLLPRSCKVIGTAHDVESVALRIASDFIPEDGVEHALTCIVHIDHLKQSIELKVDG